MNAYPQTYNYETREDYDDAVEAWMDDYEGECQRADDACSEPDWED
jgi:hypothetical protein